MFVLLHLLHNPKLVAHFNTLSCYCFFPSKKWGGSQNIALVSRHCLLRCAVLCCFTWCVSGVVANNFPKTMHQWGMFFMLFNLGFFFRFCFLFRFPGNKFLVCCHLICVHACFMENLRVLMECRRNKESFMLEIVENCRHFCLMQYKF